jgi:hypothetical protein
MVAMTASEASGGRRVGKKRSVSPQEAIVIQLVQRENESLTRLLRNLYQEFRLGEGDRSQLYEHICRELAQYFRADCCQLYLVKQQVPELGEQRAKELQVTELLSLVAAYGPWEAALKPRFVRRIFPTEYPLEADYHTTRGFHKPKACVDLCRVDYRDGEKDAAPGRSRGASVAYSDPERHLVWPWDNLYNVSRNMISCPLLRHRSRSAWKPYPVGLIKLENRRPFVDKAYKFNYDAGDLYFGDYFKLCSVAGYVRDLSRRLSIDDGSQASIFAPMHDGDGWRQHFQEHPAGRPYYEVVQKWIATQEAPTVQKLNEEYDYVWRRLSQILDLIVEAEIFLQALHTVLEKLGRPRPNRKRPKLSPPGGSGRAPTPSLFNIIDLVNARTSRSKCLDEVEVILREALKPVCQETEGRFDQNTARAICLDFASTCCGQNGPDGSGGIGNTDNTSSDGLWSKLVEEFNAPQDSPSPLPGLLEEHGRMMVADAMYKFIKQVAESILDNRPSTGAGMVPEVLSHYQCAEDVMGCVRQPPKRPKTAGVRKAADTEVCLRNAIKCLAEAQARACMYAHTFERRVDEPRLYSIQSHVSQILDNHLMERMRELDISFDQLELLGLTDSSVEQLELLDKRLDDAARAQERIIRGCLAGMNDRAGPVIDRCTVRVRAHTIHDILDKLIAPLRRHGKWTSTKVLLLEVDVEPRDLQDRAWYQGRIKKKIQNALGKDWRDGYPPKLDVDFREGDLFAPISMVKHGDPYRPVPKWLFALNETLKKFCSTENRIPPSTE